MEVANTQVIYDTASITALKSFKAQARELISQRKFGVKSYNLLFLFCKLDYYNRKFYCTIMKWTSLQKKSE